MEAQILKEQRLPLLEFERHLLGLGADTVRTEANVLASCEVAIKHHSETFTDWLETHFWIGLALGTSKMRSQNQPRSVSESVLDGGQRLAHARVVHNSAVVERNVEVNPHENAAVGDGEVSNRKFRHDVSETLGCHIVDQVAHAAGVSPLIVVPGDYLHAVAADHQGRRRIYDR